MNKLTLGSLFDGSGGFPLGGLISGIAPVWASEIEPFPIRVTTKRLPFMKHYGDVSRMDGGSIEPVDIITFGSPCQDMSIAGKREGLDGNRSGLFYEAVRIIKEMRCATNGKYPRYIVWENVPGAFSSNKGEDFRCVLESVCRIADETVSVPSVKKWQSAGSIVGDGYSVAWRVLDAQYWGIPQRRKRIYLVADFAGGSAGKVLFESEGMSGYSAESFRSWQGAAADAGEGFGETGTFCLNDQGGQRMDLTEDVTNTLRAESHHPPLVFENHSQDSRYTGPLDVAQTVLSTFGTGGNNQPFVVETPKTLKIRSGCEGGGKGPLIQDDKSATLGCNNDQTLFVPTVFGICSKESNSMKSSNPHSGIYKAETSRTLDGNGGNPSCNQGGMAVVALEGNGARPSHKGSGYSEDNVSFTLNATEQHGVAYGIDRATYNMGQNPSMYTVEMRVRGNRVRVYSGSSYTLRFTATASGFSGGYAGYRSDSDTVCELLRLGDAWTYEPYERFDVEMPDGSFKSYGRISRSNCTWDEEFQVFTLTADVEETSTRSEDISLDYDFFHSDLLEISCGGNYTAKVIPKDINIWISRLFLGDADGFSILYYQDVDSLVYWANQAAYRWKLRGMCMWSLGQEDMRLWEWLPKQI